MQHQGTYALALASALGDSDHDLAGEERAAYFNVGRTRLLHYPLQWGLPLAAMTVALWLGVVVVGFRMHLLTVGGVAIGALAFVLALVIAAATGYGFERWLADAIGARTGKGALYVGMVCGTVSVIVTAIYRCVWRRIGIGELLAPALGGWVWLALLLAVAIPGARYLFLWPGMAGVVLLGSIFLSAQRDQPIGPGHSAWLAASVVLAFVLLAPAIGLVFNARGPSVVTTIAAVCAAMTAVLFVPASRLIVRRRTPALTAIDDHGQRRDGRVSVTIGWNSSAGGRLASEVVTPKEMGRVCRTAREHVAAGGERLQGRTGAIRRSRSPEWRAPSWPSASIASRLYGLAPADPIAFAMGIAILSGVALIATCFPAYRASRVDPLVALRHE